MPTKKGGKTSTELYGTVSETKQQSKARQRVTRQRAQKPNFDFECAAEKPHDINTKSSKSAQYSQEQHKGESKHQSKAQSVHFRANRNTTKPKSEQMAQKVAQAHHGMRGKHGVRVRTPKHAYLFCIAYLRQPCVALWVLLLAMRNRCGFAVVIPNPEVKS